MGWRTRAASVGWRAARLRLGGVALAAGATGAASRAPGVEAEMARLYQIVSTALAALLAALGEYWFGAPRLMQVLCLVMPGLFFVDGGLTLAHRRICPHITPPDVGVESRRGSAGAVMARALLTLVFLILSFIADAAAGTPYAFVIFALIWGYGRHMGSAVAHARCLMLHYDIEEPSWLGSLTDAVSAPAPQPTSDDIHETVRDGDPDGDPDGGDEEE